MTHFALAKLGAQVVAGMGVSKIVGGIVKNNVAIVTTADKVLIHAGTFVLGSIAWDQASKHVEQQFDTVATWWEGRKEDTDSTEE